MHPIITKCSLPDTHKAPSDVSLECSLSECVGLQNASTPAPQILIAFVTQGVFACLSACLCWLTKCVYTSTPDNSMIAFVTQDVFACLSACLYVRTREALGEQGSPLGSSLNPRPLSPRAKAAMQNSSSSGYVCFFNRGCAPLAQSVHSGL